MSIDTAIETLKHRRTKIVATLGPRSDDTGSIRELLQAGVDVFRLNMSHGDPAGHRTSYQRIREAAHGVDRPTAVLVDLAGPKIRVGRFEHGSVRLHAGDPVTVTTRDVLGHAGLIPSQYEGLARDVAPGDHVLLADGVIELRVERVAGTEIHCVVLHGGELSDRKGINLPGVDVSAPSFTDKDRRDARFALELGADFLALSFVRRASDVHELKSLIDEAGRVTPIIAKIEKPEALARYDEILDAADGIMVARGDLGVELPPERVPVAQRHLIDRARAKNKPVIVATQMLESMVVNTRPTRAEVADVSHTVSSGADAVMLSAETATGAHPRLAVEMMDRIARQTEGYLWTQGAFEAFTRDSRREPPLPFGDAVARSTALLSRDLLVRAIVVISESGMSAATVSAARPAAPVVAVSPHASTCRKMSLYWGIVAVPVSPENLADPAALARRLTRELELAEPGQFVLTVRGFHSDPVQNTPTITLLRV